MEKYFGEKVSFVCIEGKTEECAIFLIKFNHN